MGDIFLSASVPDPDATHFIGDADSVAITSAVSALTYLALGRKKIVWGGHPAITPMVASVAQSLETDYTEWTLLYQSLHWHGDMPNENDDFPNIRFTAEGVDMQNSLSIMRNKMFSENEFDCAIFIGGMGGILDEYKLLRELQPGVPCYPIASTGGAAKELLQHFDETGISSERLNFDLDYVPLFREITGISLDTQRSRMPKYPSK